MTEPTTKERLMESLRTAIPNVDMSAEEADELKRRLGSQN